MGKNMEITLDYYTGAFLHSSLTKGQSLVDSRACKKEQNRNCCIGFTANGLMCPGEWRSGNEHVCCYLELRLYGLCLVAGNGGVNPYGSPYL